MGFYKVGVGEGVSSQSQLRRFSSHVGNFLTHFCADVFRWVIIHMVKNLPFFFFFPEWIPDFEIFCMSVK